jgi:hypothetical protein
MLGLVRGIAIPTLVTLVSRILHWHGDRPMRRRGLSPEQINDAASFIR